MSEIASKNPYDLLGNDPELDPDREPEPPTKVADKPAARHGKRNAGGEAPAPQRQEAGEGGRARGRGGRGGDRGDGGMRSRNNEDGVRPDRHPRAMRGEHRGGSEPRGRGRGGRGYSGRYTRTNRDDRGDHTGHGDHDKQAAHGWGGEGGNAEWNDERAGADIARAESKDEPGFTPDTDAGDPAFTNGPGAEGEVVGEDAVAPPEEDKTKSYDQYLAEQAEKRLALGDSSLQTRKANEGSKQKFPEGTAVERNPEQENFFIGGGGKARREKASGREKNTVALDGRYYAEPDQNDRGGGRGRGRGGRGRGEGRGEHRGGGRGRGEGRGEHRGGRGEFRGGSRGDRGGPRGAINTSDSNAFPALGGS